jgi:type IV pilus assembly protein PilE
MQIRTNKKIKGFTLIEVMITVVIVAIISAIAYPLYTDYVLSSRRAVAVKALTELSSRMQRHWQNRIPRSYPATVTSVGMASTTEGNHYTLQIASSSTTSFTVQAVAIGSSPQANDSGCTTMTLSATGQKSPAKCWKK